MKRAYFIGMDTHCQFCEVAVVNAGGDVVHRDRCTTCIPALLEVIERVPRPRHLVIEEGPLAGWLWRHLQKAVDRLVVSEPRRNRWIAQDVDKDDDLDAIGNRRRVPSARPAAETWVMPQVRSLIS